MLKKTRISVLTCISILMFGMVAMAQMMGGSRGNTTGGTTGGNGMSNNGGMHGTVGTVSGGMIQGNAGMGSGGGMDGAMGMADGAITVGSDGTLYILSRVFNQDSQTGSLTNSVNTQLSAVRGTNGNTIWSIIFDEYWLTRPIQGPDGRLFLIAFGDIGMGISMAGGNTGQNQDSKLYILNPAGQVIGQPISLAGEVASVPTIVGSGSSYVVYVVTFDMGHNSNSRSGVQGPRRESTLYAFNQNGTLLFSRPLNQ